MKTTMLLALFVKVQIFLLIFCTVTFSLCQVQAQLLLLLLFFFVFQKRFFSANNHTESVSLAAINCINPFAVRQSARRNLILRK